WAPAQLAKNALERVSAYPAGIRRTARAQDANPGSPPRLLHLGGERRQRSGQRAYERGEEDTAERGSDLHDASPISPRWHHPNSRAVGRGRSSEGRAANFSASRSRLR